ncbi:MAG: hypothetical protein RLZZ58_390, partial [Pseudomonadota bacterium]
MSVRLRDNLQSEAETSPPPAGLRGWLGLPDRDNPTPEDTAQTIDLCFTGMRWAAVANLVAIGALGALVALGDAAASGNTLITLGSCAALVMLCDIIICIPMVRRRLIAWADTRAILTLSLINLVSAAAWSAALIAAPNLGGQLAVIAGNALALGKLATLALPAVLGARLLASIGVYVAFGMNAVAAITAIGVTLVTLGMAMGLSAQRHRIQLMRNTVGGRDRAARELLGGFERSGRGWFWQTNVRGRLTYITDELDARLGTSSKDLIGTHFSALMKTGETGDFNPSQSDETIEFALAAGIEFNDLVVHAQTDDELWWSLSGTPIMDGHGRCIGYHGSGTDLSEQRKSEADANRLANYDGLTGLPNRVNMRRTLEELLDADSLRQGGCGLLLLDLDRFKNVNDTLGHPMGDALLKIVAQRLSRVVGAKGQVGRLGGDEFTVIIPDVNDRANLAELADAIINRLSLPYVIDDCSIQIGASVGVAIAPTDGNDPDDLTRNADLALYAAKGAGKGVHRFYQPEMH